MGGERNFLQSEDHTFSSINGIIPINDFQPVRAENFKFLCVLEYLYLTTGKFSIELQVIRILSDAKLTHHILVSLVKLFKRDMIPRTCVLVKILYL